MCEFSEINIYGGLGKVCEVCDVSLCVKCRRS